MSTLDLNLPDVSIARTNGPVECLGQSFPSEEARRAHYTKRLRLALEELITLDVPFTAVEDAVARLQALEHWPAQEEARLRGLAERMRDAERGKSLLQRWKDEVGFPHGEIEDILQLSDPPFYTACPNPFLTEFLEHYGRPYDPAEEYHREPFAADVSEGKNDPIYRAHSYHTKVPHKAIMRYILHYTKPGDVVFDGFCGTGMTGVAAQMCGDRKTVESLGYRVERDGTILEPEKAENGKTVWRPFSKLGARCAVINDLSPAATFIASNYNTPVNAAAFEGESQRILQEVDEECGWMYATLHKPTPDQLERAIEVLESGRDPRDLVRDPSFSWGRINYVAWSDVFTCTHCAGDVIFWDVAVDPTTWQVRSTFACPHCSVSLGRSDLERVTETVMDSALGIVTTVAKQVPVLVHYVSDGWRGVKRPDRFDQRLLSYIESKEVPYPIPTDMLPAGDKTGEPIRVGITHVHQFYTSRNLWALAAYAARLGEQRRYVNITSVAGVITKMYRFRSQNGSLGAGGGPMAGTLYVPSLSKEIPILKAVSEHITKTAAVRRRYNPGGSLVQTGSHTRLCCIADSSCDYIFVDPPFGANLMYSELNIIWESWLKARTNIASEAIENRTQSKSLGVYRTLITQCFAEAYRVLKPARWMTVEFSNTQASVWNAIQTALEEAGFVVANVAALDKKQGSFNAVNNPTSVKQDLVISAYKPAAEVEHRFREQGGTEQSVWDFVRSHLQQLPRFKAGAQGADFIAERDPRILYDRVVAWFVRHGTPVPLSSQEFQAGLAQRYVERDGMYFLPDQVAEYDRRVRQAGAVPQQELFVSDERSAIDWLREFLKKRPSVYSDITPDFMKQLGAGWSKYEERPELGDLLQLNFLQYDGRGEVPSQIHSYLSSNYAELRNLGKDDPKLVGKAKDRWYVPDPNKAIDLEKLRERQLLKEFEEYKGFGGRRLKVFRLEAVRAGFRRAWQDRDYGTIIEVARKVPDNVLQEDPLLLRWYDQALTRMGAE